MHSNCPLFHAAGSACLSIATAIVLATIMMLATTTNAAFPPPPPQLDVELFAGALENSTWRLTHAEGQVILSSGVSFIGGLVMSPAPERVLYFQSQNFRLYTYNLTSGDFSVVSGKKYPWVTWQSSKALHLTFLNDNRTILGAVQAGVGKFDTSTWTESYLTESIKPLGLAHDPADDLVYTIERAAIRQLTPADGTHTIFAGDDSGNTGKVDGTGTAARFTSLTAITKIPGALVVIDDERMIRKVELPTALVTTVAGSTTSATMDGTGLAALFKDATSLGYTAADRNLYVLDDGFIREVSPASWQVTTISSTSSTRTREVDLPGPLKDSKMMARRLYAHDSALYVVGTPNAIFTVPNVSASEPQAELLAPTPIGNIDGPLKSALFAEPSDLCIRRDGSMVITDLRSVLRIVNKDHTEVTTIGSYGAIMTVSNTPGSERFVSPKICTVGVDENDVETTYIADMTYIRSLSSTNVVSTFALNGMTKFEAGSTLLTSSLQAPKCLVFVKGYGLFVYDSESYKWVLMNPTTDSMSTVAGAGTSGADDGTGTAAEFDRTYSQAVYVEAHNAIYTVGGRTLRKMTIPDYIVTTVKTGISMGYSSTTPFYELVGVAYSPTHNGLFLTGGFTLYYVSLEDSQLSLVAGGQHGLQFGKTGYLGNPSGISFGVNASDNTTLYMADKTNRGVFTIEVPPVFPVPPPTPTLVPTHTASATHTIPLTEAPPPTTTEQPVPSTTEQAPVTTQEAPVTTVEAPPTTAEQTPVPPSTAIGEPSTPTPTPDQNKMVIKKRLRLSGNEWASLLTAKNEASLAVAVKSDIASALPGISASDVFITGMTLGSLIVDYELYVDKTFDETSTDNSIQSASFSTAVAMYVQTTSDETAPNVLSTQTISTTVGAPQPTDAPFDGSVTSFTSSPNAGSSGSVLEDKDACGTGCMILVIIVSVCIVAALIACVICSRQPAGDKKSSRRHATEPHAHYPQQEYTNDNGYGGEEGYDGAANDQYNNHYDYDNNGEDAV